MADDATTEAATDSTTETAAATGKTFTQADLDRIVQDRIARERAKFEGFDDLKAEASEFDKLQEANQSELEKAQKRAEKAEQDAAKIREAANKRLIQAEVLAQATALK